MGEKEDNEELMNCEMMFARKFDKTKSMDLIEKIYHHLVKRS